MKRPTLDYGKQMRSWRRRKGMTQADLARILGCTWRTVHNLETGKNEASFKAKSAFAALVKRHAQEPIKL